MAGNNKLGKLERELATQKKLLEYAKSKGKVAEKLQKSYDKAAEALEKHNAALSRGSAAATELLNRTTGIAETWKDSIWGSLMSSEAALEGFADKLKKTATVSNILGSTMEKIAEATFATVGAFDSAASSLAGVTGAGSKYNKQIMAIADNNRAAGVGISASAEALGTLHAELNIFTSLSAPVQNSIAAQTAAWEQFGISASTTANILKDLTSGLGMSAEEALNTQEGILRASVALGIPPAQMAESFASAMPALASWGREAPRIFNKVAAASKKLGVEMQTLLGFAEQFDTFEGAASAAGKLNAILGGDALNAYEMMNASAEERNRLLLEGIEYSGKSWESMHRFERMAVANAAGITDMNEANKLFSGGLSAYKEAEQAMADASVSAEDLAEAQKAAIDLATQGKLIFESFAVAIRPIVSGLRFVADGFLSLNDFGQGAITTIIALVAALWIATGIFLKFAAVQAAVAGASLPTAAGIGAIGAAAKIAAPGMLAFGVAVALVAGSIALMIYAVAALVRAFRDVSTVDTGGVKDFIEQASEYLEIQAKFKSPDEDAFLQALSRFQDIQSKKGSIKGGGKDIVLVLNDREVGRAIDVHLNDKNSVKLT